MSATLRYPQSVIEERVKFIAATLEPLTQHSKQVTLIGLKEGGLPLLFSLLRHFRPGHSVTYSLQDPSYPSWLNLQDHLVVIVDDILDSGHTFKKMIEWAWTCKAFEVGGVFLFARETPLQEHRGESWSIIGQSVEDSGNWLVGFGMDFNQQYRNLPSVYELDQTWTPSIRSCKDSNLSSKE